MACIKTGADIYLDCYGQVLHCDLHLFESVYIARVVSAVYVNLSVSHPLFNPDFVPDYYAADFYEWWDKDLHGGPERIVSTCILRHAFPNTKTLQELTRD